MRLSVQCNSENNVGMALMGWSRVEVGPCLRHRMQEA